MENKFKTRKTYLVYPKFQLGLIGTAVVAGLLIIAGLYGSVNYVFWKLHLMTIQMQLPADHVLVRFLYQQEMFLNAAFGVAAGLAVLFASVVGIFLSHRIAGPVYHIEKHIRMLADEKGQGTNLKLRKNDHFHELARAVNELARKRLS